MAKDAAVVDLQVPDLCNWIQTPGLFPRFLVQAITGFRHVKGARHHNCCHHPLVNGLWKECVDSIRSRHGNQGALQSQGSALLLGVRFTCPPLALKILISLLSSGPASTEGMKDTLPSDLSKIWIQALSGWTEPHTEESCFFGKAP